MTLVTATEEGECTRCGAQLNLSRAVWLELNMATNEYMAPGTVPASDSQGCFPFGKCCARRPNEKHRSQR